MKGRSSHVGAGSRDRRGTLVCHTRARVREVARRSPSRRSDGSSFRRSEVRLRPRIWEELTAFSAGASIACFAAMIDLAGSVFVAAMASATTGLALLFASGANGSRSERAARRAFEVSALGRTRPIPRDRT